MIGKVYVGKHTLRRTYVPGNSWIAGVLLRLNHSFKRKRALL